MVLSMVGGTNRISPKVSVTLQRLSTLTAQAGTSVLCRSKTGGSPGSGGDVAAGGARGAAHGAEGLEGTSAGFLRMQSLPGAPEDESKQPLLYISGKKQLANVTSTQEGCLHESGRWPATNRP